MQYFQAIKTLGIIYNKDKKDNLIIKNYFNFDQNSNYTKKKLRSRFIIILNKEPIS